MGNRISKTVTDMTGKKAPFTTYYTRDAQGNTMAVYDNSSLKSDIAICELDRPYLEKISRNIITYKAKSLIAEEEDFYQNSINEYISQNWQGDSCKYKYMSLISEKNITCFIEQEDYNIIEQLYYQDFGYFQSVETSARKSYLSQKYNEHYENMGERTYCFIQELSIAMEQPIDAFEAWLMHQKRTDLRSKLDVFYTELAQTSIYYGILNDTAYQDSLYWKEQHLYGSSRLGIAKPELEVTNFKNSNFSLLTSNFRNYELTNHLGNVLSTIKDEKQQKDQNADGIVDYYEPIVMTANDYYPFGMVMPNRSFSLAGSNYRFGFNGKENDNEVDGQQDYGLRIYDNRIGRFKSVDPLAKSYPFYTPYQFSGNNPIRFIDLDGGEPGLPELEVINNGLRSIYNFPSNLRNKINESLTNAVKYSPVRENGTVVIDHTTEAFAHYYTGRGESVQLGPKTIANIKNSDDVKKYRDNIQSGKTTLPAKPDGKLSVNMTLESARTFHLGKMTLDYQTKCNKEQCTTTFNVNGDGFNDPDYIDEYGNKALNKIGINIPFLKPDGAGPNLERGGTPYEYKTVTWSETYKNPGYKTDNNENPQPIIKETKK